jgi:hypothetical protein
MLPKGDLAQLAKRGRVAQLAVAEIEAYRAWKARLERLAEGTVPCMRGAVRSLERLAVLQRRQCDLHTAAETAQLAQDLDSKAAQLQMLLDGRATIHAAAAVHIKAGGDT